MVVAIILARENDNTLYTAWYCKSLIEYITIAAKLKEWHELQMEARITAAVKNAIKNGQKVADVTLCKTSRAGDFSRCTAVEQDMSVLITESYSHGAKNATTAFVCRWYEATHGIRIVQWARHSNKYVVSVS